MTSKKTSTITIDMSRTESGTFQLSNGAALGQFLLENRTAALHDVERIDMDILSRQAHVASLIDELNADINKLSAQREERMEVIRMSDLVLGKGSVNTPQLTERGNKENS